MVGASKARICALWGVLSAFACAQGEDLAPGTRALSGTSTTNDDDAGAATSTGSSGSAANGSGGTSGAPTEGSGTAGNTAGSSGEGGAGTGGAGGASGASGNGGASTGGAPGTGGAGGSGGSGGANNGGGGNGGGGNGGGAPDGGPKEASVDAGGSAGGSIDASTELAPACSTSDCKLKVQYQCRQNGLGALKEMSFLLKVVTGTTAIPLSAVTVRYYFTIDSTAAQQADCDSLTFNCSSVSFSFKTVTPAKPTADRYLEIGFTGAGTIAPGADTGEIGIRIHDQANLATYMQGNDYSFFSTGAVYYDRMEMPGYAGGTKVWGTEP
jgi:hypothetical protein